VSTATAASTRNVVQVTIEVIYNGITKPLPANPKAAVQSLLQHAIKAFGITQNPHVLSLFTNSNVEVDDHRSLSDQHIEDGETLLLRPSTVKGGVR